MLTTVAVAGQKGGTGKTTLALALAAAHERAGGRAVVLDMDPQGSAVAWGRLRNGIPPPVVRTHPPRLALALKRLQADGFTLAVVDTAPREAGGVVEAARLAAVVLIPCRCSALDVLAVAPTLQVVALARAVVVLNGCPARGAWTTEAREALAGLGADVAPVTVGDRVAHRRAFTAGRTALELEPRSLAAEETVALYRSFQVIIYTVSSTVRGQSGHHPPAGRRPPIGCNLAPIAAPPCGGLLALSGARSLRPSVVLSGGGYRPWHGKILQAAVESDGASREPAYGAVAVHGHQPALRRSRAPTRVQGQESCRATSSTRPANHHRLGRDHCDRHPPGHQPTTSPSPLFHPTRTPREVAIVR